MLNLKRIVTLPYRAEVIYIVVGKYYSRIIIDDTLKYYASNDIEILTEYAVKLVDKQRNLC